MAVVAGLGERKIETLRHKTKGDADYKTHEEEQVTCNERKVNLSK